MKKDKFKNADDFLAQSCAIFDATACTIASDTIKRFANEYDKQLKEKMQDGSWIKEKMETINFHNNRFAKILAES
ncbi:hypothetical protein [Methylobacter sp.]|uniref:hypothetical protein n=1 Tax=Methylobacter sp. TaxID=2051955 RepID=UPI003DA6982C